MASDRIAGAVEQLNRIGDELIADYPHVESYSSVYGRFWVVPRSVRDAIGCAGSVLDAASSCGLRLGIGLSVGQVDKTRDLLEDNVAGMAINHAARLAFLSRNIGRIAVDSPVVQDAIDAGPYTVESFSGPRTGTVKRTELSYRWFRRPLVALGDSPSSSIPETLAHIVVYDIVRYSEKAQRDMVLEVTDLRRSVLESLGAAGLAGWADSPGLWYAPAGDGGVVIFGPGRARAAWSFARALLGETSGRTAIRLGIATGIVVVVDPNYPVGKGILKADRLSGLAEVGQPCVTARFWDSLEDHDRQGWRQIPAPDDPNAVRLLAVAQTAPPPIYPGGDGPGSGRLESKTALCDLDEFEPSGPTAPGSNGRRPAGAVIRAVIAVSLAAATIMIVSRSIGEGDPCRRFSTDWTDQQVIDWLREELVRINPAAAGSEIRWRGDGAQRVLELHGDSLLKIDPVACLGAALGAVEIHARVADLGPLRGLALWSVECQDCPIDSLEPLDGSRGTLTHLALNGCGRIGSIEQISSMRKLQYLDIYGTGVDDLSPLVGLVLLRELNCAGTGVSGLEVVSQLPGLENLTCDEDLARRSGFLLRHPSLRRINGTPLDRFAFEPHESAGPP